MIFRRTSTPWKRPDVLKQKSKKSGNLIGRTLNGVPFGIQKHEPTFNTQSGIMYRKSQNLYAFGYNV